MSKQVKTGGLQYHVGSMILGVSSSIHQVTLGRGNSMHSDPFFCISKQFNYVRTEIKEWGRTLLTAAFTLQNFFSYMKTL